MFKKKLQSCVPEHFRASLSEYWMNDVSFLSSSLTIDMGLPSFACLIADSYARSTGKGVIERQTAALFLCYHSYFTMALDTSLPLLFVSRRMCDLFAADFSLKKLEIDNPCSVIAADLAKIRKTVYNYPSIDIFVVDQVTEAYNSFSETSLQSYSIKYSDYTSHVTIKTYSNVNVEDRDVVKFYKDTYSLGNFNKLTVMDFFAVPDPSTNQENVMFLSHFFLDDIIVNQSINDHEVAIKDLLDIVNAVKSGMLVESSTAASVAWHKLRIGKKKRKQSSSKLYSPREMIISLV